MCGIAGVVAPAGVDPSALDRMTGAVAHRGPDGCGYLFYRPGTRMAVAGSVKSLQLEGEATPTVGFGHRRLSIIDLTDASDQPMIDTTGRYALTYNGEIYNYLELRAELERLGHVFQTTGDTEVVLTAYKEWGPRCVERFVGMWAFALLDGEGDNLFLSRDRFGIKPLFYSVVGGALHFASEIKALLASGAIHAEPDAEAVQRFLLTGRVDASEKSSFQGVFQLLPAHNALIPLASPATMQLSRYWKYPSCGYEGTVSDAADEFSDLFHDAVRLHVRADVPVGTCLSGGLDSSAIVCVAGRLREQGEIPQYAHRGFGYVTHDEALSERPYMEDVVRKAGLAMTYVRPTSERAVEAIPLVVRQQDEPFGTASIVVQWFVFEAARRAGIKVMLDGQGADEMLGGYHSYLRMQARGLLRRWKVLRYAGLAADHQRLLGRPPLTLPDVLASAAPALRKIRAARRTTLPHAASVMSEPMRSQWRRFDDPVLYPRSVNEILERAGSVQLPALLRFEDRNSMAHSIEARVPFLDHRLVELAFRLPGDYKMRRAETKHVLREGMAGTLPEPVRLRQDKVGFRPDPDITWRFARLHQEALLSNGTEFEERWFDSSAVARLMDGADRSPDAEAVLWRVISTKLWLRNHWSEERLPS